INKFEHTAADLAVQNGYDFVVCGHIHQPEMRTVSTEEGNVAYLNSGDWVENLTALEYQNKVWKIFKYDAKDFEQDEAEEGQLSDSEDLHSKLDINTLLQKIKLEIV
ncbi:MAG: UDP-2,3-diacylglucosamine diphosphatase, partial [Pedobacter sp.]